MHQVTSVASYLALNPRTLSEEPQFRGHQSNLPPKQRSGIYREAMLILPVWDLTLVSVGSKKKKESVSSHVASKLGFSFRLNARGRLESDLRGPRVGTAQPISASGSHVLQYRRLLEL